MTKIEKQRRHVLRIERRRPFLLLPRLALTLCSTYGSKPWVSISAFPMVSHSAGLRRRRNQFNPAPFRHVDNEHTTLPATSIFSPLAVARLYVTQRYQKIKTNMFVIESKD